MAFVGNHEIYDALPISNDALDRGGVEMLRAGVVDEELLVTARRVFADPAHWGYLLADVVRRLATLYAAEGDFTEAKASAAIAAAFARSLRTSGIKSVKSARARVKAKPSPKPVARRKSARAKP
jgi:hypothetical protein